MKMIIEFSDFSTTKVLGREVIWSLEFGLQLNRLGFGFLIIEL